MTPKKMNTTLKVLLVLLIVGSVAGIYFANQKLTSLASDTARLKAEIQVSEKQVKAYKQTEEKVSSLSYVDELAKKVLPEDKEQSVVVAELSQFALRSRLGVEEIAFPESARTSSSKDKPKTPKGVEVVPITIKFKEGSKYENLLEFLKTVETNRRKMQVTNIALVPDEENRSVLKEVTVSINLYSKSTAIQEKK